MIALGFLALFAAVAIACIASLNGQPTAQQQAMADEWHTYLDTLPVLKEDPR